jgi:hypothetical protein
LQDAIDYAITQANRARASSTPATANLSASTRSTLPAEFPGPYRLASHLLFHALLISLCILTLVEFWSRTLNAAFAVFLVWTLVLYSLVAVFAFFGRPSTSLLAVIISRLRAPPLLTFTEPPLPTVTDNSLPDTRGPYIHHQPPFRMAGHDDSSISPRSIETHDEDEDEDTRQQRIEEEMGRRDVSIVTVPRRKLWIANPS